MKNNFKYQIVLFYRLGIKSSNKGHCANWGGVGVGVDSRGFGSTQCGGFDWWGVDDWAEVGWIHRDGWWLVARVS